METNINASVAPQEAVKANWDALTDAVVTEAPAATEVKPETPAVEPPVVKTEEKPVEGEIKPNTETKPETEPPAVKTEEKPTEPAETPELKLDVSDIKDAPKVFEEDTFQGLAQKLGFEIAEENFDVFQQTFKDGFVTKAEADKIRSQSKEDLLTQFAPDVAAAIKMKDLGIPDQYIFNPTAQHDYLLSLDDAQLIRQKLSSTPGVTEESVDAKMEELATGGQLTNLAAFDRAQLTNERQNILATQSQYIQQFTEKQKLAAVKVKEQSDKQFLDALDKASSLAGIPVTKEAKQIIATKFKKGDYDKALDPAESKVQAILLKEFGPRLIETLSAKAEAKGKASIVEKFSDIPLKKEVGAGRPVAQQESGQNSNWDALIG